MKEKEAREMLKELFERHNVPSIPINFDPKPITTKKQVITKLGGTLTYTVKMHASFNIKVNVDPTVADELWFEFYGLPSPTTIRHEFKHYLNYLGVKYIRKK